MPSLLLATDYFTWDAACDTWLDGYKFNIAKIEVHTDTTQSECWSHCDQHATCNAVTWKDSDGNCQLQLIPEDEVSEVQNDEQCKRRCEPGVKLHDKIVSLTSVEEGEVSCFRV